MLSELLPGKNDRIDMINIGRRKIMKLKFCLFGFRR